MSKSESRRPPAPECNLLWALSRGTCAYPDCDRKLVVGQEGGWTTTGEIAHIRAHSAGGPRFDPSWAPERVDTYENCLLMCLEHHRMVDRNPGQYPTEVLLRWKETHETPVASIGAPISAFVHFLEPPPRARLFLLRDREQATIASELHLSGRLALTGISGSGKTQLARHWFSDADTSYAFQWWLRGDSRETLIIDLAALAPFLNVPVGDTDSPPNIARRVQAALSERTAWLIVVDNADSPEHLVDLLPETGGHLLITTQDQSWEGTIPCRAVPPFDDRESESLLRKSPILATTPQQELLALADRCARLPLALDQATSYLAKTGMPIAAYTEILASRRVETLQVSGVPGRPVTESIKVTLDEIGSDERDVLGILAYVGSGPFDLSFVACISEEEGDRESWDVLRTEAALGQLRSFSLIQRDNALVVAHELVLDVLRAEMTEAEHLVALVRASLSIVQQLPEQPGESFAWPSMETLLPHALSVLSHTDTLTGRGFVLATGHILNRVGQYYNGRGEADRARELYEIGIKLMRESEDEEGLSTLGSIMHNLAESYSVVGDLPKALDLHRSALEIKERAVGPDALIVGVSCAAIAVILTSQGCTGEAHTFHQRALRTYQRHGDHAWASNALIDLAGLAFDDGDEVGAERLLKDAIEEANQTNRAIPESVTARLRLADLRSRSGDVLAAVSLAKQARIIAAGASAPTQLAQALRAQARHVRDLGELDGAVGLHRRAWRIEAQLRARDPIGLAKSRGNHGFDLVMCGRADLGLVHLDQSLTDLEQQLPSSDGAVAVARLLVVKALMELARPVEALELLEQVVQDGPDSHEATTEAREMLALLERPGGSTADE